MKNGILLLTALALTLALTRQLEGSIRIDLSGSGVLRGVIGEE